MGVIDDYSGDGSGHWSLDSNVYSVIDPYHPMPYPGVAKLQKLINVLQLSSIILFFSFNNTINLVS